jgi:hypothetical protein
VTPGVWVREYRRAKAISSADGATRTRLVTVGRQLSLTKKGARLIKSRALAHLRSSGHRNQLAFWLGARLSHWRWVINGLRTARALEPQPWSTALSVRQAGDTS